MLRARIVSPDNFPVHIHRKTRRVNRASKWISNLLTVRLARVVVLLDALTDLVTSREDERDVNAVMAIPPLASWTNHIDTLRLLTVSPQCYAPPCRTAPLALRSGRPVRA